jgi:MFS family permease
LTALLALATSGSSPLPFTRLVVAAFRRHRGLAVGLVMAGTGIGAIVAPAVLAPVVASAGWRQGYLLLSALVLAATVPVALLLRGAETTTAPGPAQPLAVILRDRAFRVIGVPIFLASTAILGTVVHFVPMLTDGGLAPARTGASAAVIGGAAIVGRLAIGVLLDRIAPGRVTMGLFALAAAGIATLALGGTAVALPAAAVIGLAVGAEGNLISVLTARHFAPRLYGQAYGALYTLFLIGAALGPALIGFLFDASHGYRVPLLLSAGALAVPHLPPSA